MLSDHQGTQKRIIFVENWNLYFEFVFTPLKSAFNENTAVIATYTVKYLSKPKTTTLEIQYLDPPYSFCLEKALRWSSELQRIEKSTCKIKRLQLRKVN